MTSDFKDTPVYRTGQVLKNLGGCLMRLVESLEKDHTVSIDDLSDFFQLAGELSWMAGALEATRVLAACRDDDESLIVH